MALQSAPLQTLADIRDLLAARGVRPKHRLGQNFLHDQNLIRKLIHAAALEPGELILEVGPGTGALTEALLESAIPSASVHAAAAAAPAAALRIVACELDRDMIAILQDRLAAFLAPDQSRSAPATPHTVQPAARLTIIEGDCLDKGRRLNPRVLAAIGERPFKLVSNLPYSAASPLISTLLIEHHDQCRGQYVTIQKEVAQRLTAQPGTKDYGSLGVVVQSMADVRAIASVSPGCFWPQPQVTSAMVAITPREHAGGAVPLRADERRAFARFVTKLFASRRKQLGTIFGRQRPEWSSLASAGVTPALRSEALSTWQMLRLWRVLDPDASTNESGT